MASGHANRANRPNTWLPRPSPATWRFSLPTRSRPHMALCGFRSRDLPRSRFDGTAG